LKIINDWSSNLFNYTSISGPWPALNVLSVRFSADSIVVPSTHNKTAQMMYGQNSINSNSSETPMDTQHPQQGRLGTPDAINQQASYMSSEFKKSQEQTASQMADYGNAQDLFVKLSEALALEPKFQPNLFLPLQSNVSTSTFPLHFRF
jgi:hypothetical protein